MKYWIWRNSIILFLSSTIIYGREAGVKRRAENVHFSVLGDREISKKMCEKQSFDIKCADIFVKNIRKKEKNKIFCTGKILFWLPKSKTTFSRKRFHGILLKVFYSKQMFCRVFVGGGQEMSRRQRYIQQRYREKEVAWWTQQSQRNFIRSRWI